jgi:uncharacterized membrane protein YdjX (TVP38/TMEM64 family)/Fe-S oxidoreductase
MKEKSLINNVQSEEFQDAVSGLNGTDAFMKTCKSCGKCSKACPFLRSFGTPGEIISQHPQDAFFCTNCGKCTLICPEGFFPSNALFETKHRMIQKEDIPVTVRNAIESARGFAMRGHKFPFSHYPSTDTVFWPGCGLAGTSPEIVKKTVQILSDVLKKKVGLLLDCCFDPVYQVGDISTVEKIIGNVKTKLEKHGIKHVITGCPNCTKFLSKYLPEIKVEHVLEVLPGNAITLPCSFNAKADSQNALSDSSRLPPLRKVEAGGYYLHHPCPSFSFEGTQRRARSLMNGKNESISETRMPSCCGCGGGLDLLSKELSDSFAEGGVRLAGGNVVLTYCMGCKGRFLEKGGKAYHLLEFLPGIIPLEKPVSSAKKWINRFSLAMGQRIMSKKLFLGLIVILCIFFATYLRKQGYISPEAILGAVRHYSAAAPFIFLLLYAVGPSLFIPSLPLTLGAGFLWGPFWGVILSITGATIGASVPFLLSRYIMGESVRQRFSNQRWQGLAEKVEKHGWKAVAFARLVPVFPFPVLNYLFGITPIPFLHYLWSTFVFMLPACIAYVAFGSSMGELVLKGNIRGLVIGILIATAALLLPFALKPLFRKTSSSKDE